MSESARMSSALILDSGWPGRLIWAIWILFLMAFFIGQPLFGSYGSAAALIMWILALPLLFFKDVRAGLAGRKAIWMFPLAYLLLVGPFFITATEPHDLIYAFNFIVFLLAVPAFAVAQFFKGEKWSLMIAFLSLAGAVLCLLIAGVGVLGFEFKRAGGIMSNPNMLAQVTTTFGFVALSGFYLFDSRWRFLFLGGPIIAGVVIMLAGSRGVLVSAMPLAVFALIFLALRRGGRRWVYAGVAVAAILVGSLLVVDRDALTPIKRAMSLPQVVTNVIEGKPIRDWSTSMRIELYKGAVRAFWESPIIGHGWQNAVRVAARDIPGQSNRYRLSNAKLAARWPNMHNDPLGFAAASGVFGIASYILLLAAPFALIGRRDAFFVHRLYIVLCLVTSTFIHGLIDAPFGHDMGVNTYTLLTVIVMAVFRKDSQDKGAENQDRTASAAQTA